MAGSELSDGSMNALLGSLLFVFVIICFVMMLLSVICNWKIFKKAGQKGFASLIPIYNTYVLIKSSGLATWYLLLYFIPIANIYATIRVKYDLTKRFGYGAGMALLYIFIPIIPMFIFAFKATYTVVEKKENDEFINPDSALATDPMVDPFMNFTPVQGENAVPYEEGAVAYFPQQNIDTNVELEIKDDIKSEKVLEKKNVEEVVYKPNVPSVAFEEGTVAYEQPKKMEIPKEVVVVKSEPVVMENMPEPETIVIPTGEQIVENVVLPEGVKAPIIDEINQNVSSTKEESTQMKVCPKCGMKIEIMADACFMCGTKF